MAQTEESSGTSAPVDRLKEELTQLGTALAKKLADRLSDKIGEVTKNLAEAGGEALQPKELAKTAAKSAVPGAGGRRRRQGGHREGEEGHPRHGRRGR